MDSCRVPVVFAYLFSAYVMASIIYMLATICIGTPFRDSLTEAQRRIKEAVVKKRGRIFYSSLVFSGLLLYLVKPF
jgi:hypothetical protein